MRAVLAAHDMAAESRRAATLDRAHHLHLAEPGAPPGERSPKDDCRSLRVETPCRLVAHSKRINLDGSTSDDGVDEKARMLAKARRDLHKVRIYLTVPAGAGTRWSSAGGSIRVVVSAVGWAIRTWPGFVKGHAAKLRRSAKASPDSA
jgi:hypothetical protein